VVGLVFLLSLCNAELLVRKTLTNTEILSSRAVVVKINIFNTGKTYIPLSSLIEPRIAALDRALSLRNFSLSQ
jgi:hypothetical protein